MKNYLFWTFKRKLPLFVIVAVIFFILAIVSATEIDFLQEIYDGERHFYRNSDSGTLPLIIAFFTTMFFLPFFSMSYRYSLTKSDTFRQVAFKDKRLRYGEHLVTLIPVLAAFIVSFIFLTVVMMARNYNTVVPQPSYRGEYLITYELIKFNYVYFIPLFFATLGLGIGQYFISYLFISRSNNFLNSLILLGLSQGLLVCIVIVPTSFVLGYPISSIYAGATVAHPIIYLYNQFNYLIIEGTENISDIFNPYVSSNYSTIQMVSFILSIIIYFGLIATGISAFLLEKDPSSEYANKPQTDKPYQEIIFHLAVGAIATNIFITVFGNSPLTYVMFYVLFIASYYTLYGLMNRNFKLNKKQIITLVAVILAVTILGLTQFIIETTILNK